MTELPEERFVKMVVDVTTTYLIEVPVEAHISDEEALKRAKEDSCLYEYFQGNSVSSAWLVRLPDSFDSWMMS